MTGASVAMIAGMTTKTLSALGQLAQDADQRRDIDQRRNQLIVQARLDGVTWRVIADTLGMTQTAVITAARVENDGVLPRPRQEGST